MGNQQPKQEIKVESQYINHPKFHDVHIVTKEGEPYIQLQIPVHSESEVATWQNRLKQIQTFNREPLLLPSFHTFEKQGMCGSGGILTILFQNYPYVLNDEILNRKNLDRRFEENELWYLLFVLLNGAKDFQSKGLKVGDIRPANILINQEGQLKLINVLSWPSEETNYYKTMINHETTYLAPEELALLESNNNQPTYNVSTADSFSIGLTLADSGLLSSSNGLYNSKNFKFDNQMFNNIINQWRGLQYSPFLKDTVLSLLQLDSLKRKSPLDVYNLLLPYEDDIRNLRPFTHEIPVQQRMNPFQLQQQHELVQSHLVPEYHPPVRQTQVVQQQTFTTIPQQTPIYHYQHPVVQYQSPQLIPQPQIVNPQSVQTVAYNQRVVYNQPPSIPNITQYSYHQPPVFLPQQQPYVYSSEVTRNAVVTTQKVTTQSTNKLDLQSARQVSSIVPKTDTLDEVERQIMLSRQRFPS